MKYRRMGLHPRRCVYYLGFCRDRPGSLRDFFNVPGRHIEVSEEKNVPPIPTTESPSYNLKDEDAPVFLYNRTAYRQSSKGPDDSCLDA